MVKKAQSKVKVKTYKKYFIINGDDDDDDDDGDDFFRGLVDQQKSLIGTMVIVS